MNFLFESRLCYNIQNLPKKGDHLGSNLKIKNEKKTSFKYLFMRISYITSFIISVFLILSLHCLYFNWVLIIHIWYHQSFKGPRVAQWVRSLDLTAHTSLSPIRRGFAPNFVNDKKGCTRLAAASDKASQLLGQGRWFSTGAPASSTNKTGNHDIAEILLKVALNTKIKTQIHSKL
jgi:hypothetical protein